MDTQKQPDTDILAARLRPLLTRLVRKLRKLSPVNNMLSQSERAVLVLLEQHSGLLSGELALMEKMTPQSMGQLLIRLADLKLIVKTVSASDKRKVIISLSAEGAEMIRRVRSDRDEWLSRAITEVCTGKEQAVLEAALVPLAKLVDFE